MAVCYCKTNIVSSNLYIDPPETWKYYEALNLFRESFHSPDFPNENVLSNAMSVKLWESCICSQLLTVRLQFVVLSFGVSKSTRILIIKGNFLGLVIWWTLSSNCSISLPRGNSISKFDFSRINAYVYYLYKYFCDFTLAVESSTGKVRIKAELKHPPLALPVSVYLPLQQPPSISHPTPPTSNNPH